MAYDEGLAHRLRQRLQDCPESVEKKMFGGLCFMVSGHMCCGIVGDTLMARVGPENYDHCLEKEHAREMGFTGRAMKGMVYISPAGIESDDDFSGWVDTCLGFIRSLPPRDVADGQR